MLLIKKEMHKKFSTVIQNAATDSFSGPERQDETGQTGQYGGRHSCVQL